MIKAHISVYLDQLLNRVGWIDFVCYVPVSAVTRYLATPEGRSFVLYIISFNSLMRRILSCASQCGPSCVGDQ